MPVTAKASSTPSPPRLRLPGSSDVHHIAPSAPLCLRASATRSHISRPFDFPIFQIEFWDRQPARSGQYPFWRLEALLKPAQPEQVALERGRRFGSKARGLAKNQPICALWRDRSGRKDLPGEMAGSSRSHPRGDAFNSQSTALCQGARGLTNGK